MDEQPPQGRAALAGCPHRCKSDGTKGEVEIGRGRDNGGVVTPKLQDCARKAGGKAWAYGASHSRRTGCGDDSHSAVVDEGLTNILAADENHRQVRGCISKPVHRTPYDGLRCERSQRSLFRRLPDHRIAADQGQRGIPRPYRHWKVKRGDDTADTKRVPSLHHSWVAALRRNGFTVN